MDNFRIIYKILSALEKAMDCDVLDIDAISPEKLKISENRWCAIMKMLANDGYITGLRVAKSIGGEQICANDISITLKGLEYLNSDSFMKKAADAAKGAVDVAVGIASVVKK